jgi:hypothetical protein
VKEKSYTRGESWVTLGGNEMESEVMEVMTPIGQTTKWKVAWEQVLEIVNGFQVLEYLQKIVVPARDTRKDKYTSQISNGQESEACCPIYKSKQ